MRNLVAATALGLAVALTGGGDARAGFFDDFFKPKATHPEYDPARNAMRKEDYTEAMREWERLATLNDREALYQSGLLYEENRGQQARALDEWDRLEQAARRYHGAASQGHADAAYRLGRLLARGAGVVRDPIAAAGYFRQAAIADHGKAQYEYGNMLAAGVGVPQDEYAALTWYIISSQRNDVSPAEPAAEAICDRLRRKLDLALQHRLALERPGERFRELYTRRAPVDQYEIMPARIWAAMERAVDFTPEGPTAGRGKPGLPTWRCFSGRLES